MRNTPNYNLPQYEGTDKFTKEVLNDAFSKIDIAIDDLQETFNINGTGSAITTQEVVNARGGKENLKERIDEINTKADTNASQLDTIIKNDYLNVKDYGAIGEGTTNDTEAIQDCLIDACLKNKSVFMPSGTYMIDKPLIVLGKSNEMHPSINFVGENSQSTTIRTLNTFSSHFPSGNLSEKAIVIFGNETNIDVAKKSIKQGTGNNYSITMTDMFLDGTVNKYADIGITPGVSANTTFKRLRIRDCKDAGIKTNGNFYLNILEKIRVDCCPTSFDFTAGIKTSVKLDSCYSVSAQIGYKIRGIYMSMINCCVDNCSDTCFDFTGYNGSVINCGSESENALVVYKGGQYTNVNIMNGLTYGNFENPNATHILCYAGATMNFTGGWLAFDKTETGRTMLGYLHKQDTLTSLNIENCKYSKYTKKDDIKKDLSQKFSLKNGNGSFNSRHKHDLKFIGYDTIDKDQHEDAQAIYFGMGESLGWKQDGTDIRYHKSAQKGDICLSKATDKTLSVGWVNASEGTGFTSGGAKWFAIPTVQSMTTDEIKALDSTKIAFGFCIFNSTIGKPVWKKTTNVWVTADGVQI